MALNYKQTVVQESDNYIPKRFVVQYNDDVAQEDKQQIIDYDSLTTEEKATYDAFQTLAESKMV